MDIATIDSLLTKTRSVRKCLDLTRSVEPEITERCIEITIQFKHPLRRTDRTSHFMVVTEPIKKSALSDIHA